LFTNPQSLGKGTDWQDIIFNDNAKVQNHELSLSAGNDKSTYFASFGYYDQDGIVATDISNYRRFTARFNSNHKLKSWFTFGNNLGYAHIRSQGIGNTNSEFGGPLSSAINLDPITQAVITDPAIANAPPYSNHTVFGDANGNPYGISQYVAQEMVNPLAYIKGRLGNYGWSDNFVGNVFVEVEPIKGLKIKSNVGTKLAFWGNESFTPIAYYNAVTSSNNTSFFRETNRGLIWNWENTISYTRNFRDHNVTFLVGTAAFKENARGTNVTYRNLPVSTFEQASMNYNVSTADRIGGGWENPDHKLSSLFARVTYNYKERYLLTAIVRRDGSSRFGSNNKYGYFPSASAGWVVSNEKFWNAGKTISFLKIRGSYGVTGSENIGDFQYVSTIGGGRNYTFGQDNYVIGYSPNAPSNPDLKWEETSQLNIGFEALVMNKLSVTFDWYNKKTTGMLQPVILPGYVGATGSPTGNVASMTNKGVELELGYRTNIGKVTFDIKGNVSYLKNEVTNLGTVQYRTGANFQSSDYELTRIAVGQAIGSFYGFQIVNIFQNQAEVDAYRNKNNALIQPNAKPGDFKFADLNGDGQINADDRTFIGDPTPNWSYGFTLNTAYKGFDLLVFGQGVAGNQIFNGLRRLDIAAANWTTAALNRWTGEGTSNSFPRIINGDPNKNFSSPSAFYLSDGAYFRIKTVQLGYSLPKSVVSKAGLQRIRIYVGANNLVTFTKYTGFDPEIGGGSYGIDRGVYPQARTYMVGINLGLN
jgi:TonB-linked SusC/RagA family outer membrane protein